MGLPGGSASKESAFNVGDLGSIPGFRRSPGEGKGYPLQFSGLENSIDCIIHGISKVWTQLSDFHSLIYTAILNIFKIFYIFMYAVSVFCKRSNFVFVCPTCTFRLF